jgi:hypothetical protein
MREHFRSFDSKISFFAFADIITAVSGMLIFITLLLATDLGRPTNSQTPSSDPELERQLKETLAKQAEVDAANERLQGLMAAANTAPDPKKLQADIVRLRAELADEKSKHSGMSEDLAASKTALDTQDSLLGITDVRGQIQKEAQDLAAIGRDESKVRDHITDLEKEIASVESKIHKLHAREGQVWLIPDRSSNPKEPILATVSGSTLSLDRFNHPEQSQHFNKSGARSGLESYLKQAKPQDQYVVFLIRPSGIALFKQLVQTARDSGFEVGFDALEEDREIHFSAPPPIDDEATSEKRPLVINGEPYSGGTTRGGSPIGHGTGSARNGTTLTGGGSASGGDGTDPAGTANGSRNGTAAGAGSSAPGQSGQSSSSGNQTGSAESNSRGETNGSPAALTNGSAAAGSETNNGATGVSATNGVPPPPPPPKPKSWWQRFLEWIGLG